MRPENVASHRLSEIAELIGTNAAPFDPEIFGVVSDSQEVKPGDLFVALSGSRSHGAQFANEVAARGAAAILTDVKGVEITTGLTSELPIISVRDPRVILGPLSDWFYGSPSLRTYVAGITGTNGKTTTTYLLEQIWQAAQRTTGLIGTIGVKVGETELASTRTTPEGDQLQRYLATMVEAGATNIAMEVSSHALVQRRVLGTHFAAVGFSNLSQDHLDYHGDMESYYLAKRSLFDLAYGDRAFINIDDSYGMRLFDELDMPKVALSTKDRADWYFESKVATSNGFLISIRGTGGILIEGEFPLLGGYNLDNLLMAIAIASDSGVDPLVIANNLSALTGAPGRLERVAPEAPFRMLVDYAHTPDAVTKVLKTVNDLGAGRVIALLGCGGDRDGSKRPLMGAALNAGCDIPIFTSDNPRSESARSILEEMVVNLNLKPEAEVIEDRRVAIRRAIELAEPGDIVIVLGKGHESGQEIAGVKLPFSDRDELLAAFQESR